RGANPRRSGPAIDMPERVGPGASLVPSRAASLDLGPARQRDNVLERLEIDGVVLARGSRGHEVGECALDRACDAKDQRGWVSDHGEAEAVEPVWREHRRTLPPPGH